MSKFSSMDNGILSADTIIILITKNLVLMKPMLSVDSSDMTRQAGVRVDMIITMIGSPITFTILCVLAMKMLLDSVH